MSKDEKKPENNEEEPIQTIEQVDSDEEFQKKELSPQEEKEIFGDSEKTETEEILEIYRDKKPYEIELHKEFGVFPNEWIQEEVVKLMQSDHALIRNWNEVNDWIREIAVKLNSGVLIAKMVKEFCPARCLNPLEIDEGSYALAIGDGDTIDHVVQDCLSCPLYPYGEVNAFEHRPDSSYSEYQLGKSLKAIRQALSSEELPEDAEKERSEEDSETTEPSDLS